MSNPGLSEVGSRNLRIYRLIYSIEVALRELVIDLLSASCGQQWWKQRIPEEVRKNAAGSCVSARRTRWSQFTEYHPIYYTTFPELRQIIERADNWREVFEPLFGRKDVIVATLVELEPIRNKIAHNRRATESDDAIVTGAYEKMVSSIGPERFAEMVARGECATSVKDLLVALREEGGMALGLVEAVSPIEALAVWRAVEGQWWMDDEYMGTDLASIREYFGLVSEYSRTPRRRGSGHKLEAWVRKSRVRELYEASERVFEDLLFGR